MIAALLPRELRPVFDKVQAAERITDDDALALYASHDLNALGAIANVVRERKNGNVATYLLNRYINYSNVCILSCQFCAFAAKKRDAHAFEKAIPEIVETVRGALGAGDHRDPHGRRAAPFAEGRLVSRIVKQPQGARPEAALEVLHGGRNPAPRQPGLQAAAGRNPRLACATPAWVR